jgi:Ser/Thr protein kinase RdoA (MazF antagonist)
LSGSRHDRSGPPTDAELVAALEASLSCQRGRAIRISGLERQPLLYYSSYPLETITVELAAGERLDLVFKNLSPTARLPTGPEAKPAFRYDPGREIACYSRLLTDEAAGPPRCYGALVDPDRGRYWLFLEQLDATRLNQLGELTVWQAAARWLAAFHSRYSRRVAELRQLGSLLEYDAAYFCHWLPRARAIQIARGGGAARPFLSRLEASYDAVIERLTTAPRTLIHGEFYPSNVLVSGDEAAPAIHPIDWETAGLGPGALDLAALTAGGWTDDQRRSIVEAYLSVLEPAPGWSGAAFFDLLESCRLHLAVQALGWSATWTAPADTANDWLAEAERAASRLGI